MEALVPAFLFTLLAQAGERSPWLTAILADRYRRPMLVALAATMGQGIGIALAAALGTAIAGRLAPNAQQLFLALALLFAAAGTLFRNKAPDRLQGWALGPLLTPLLGILILAFGDAAQFFVLALAAKGLPVFAAVGAILGALVVAFAAAMLGEAGWTALPLKWVRWGGGLLFLVIGLVLALDALRLT
jgi:Ca2+/H+ antiporter, TMEM165/GDT1 family